eukprot:SAG31_NODE_2400_length_5775_cov_2.602185_7_plen_57_part_00
MRALINFRYTKMYYLVNLVCVLIHAIDLIAICMHSTKIYYARQRRAAGRQLCMCKI